MFSWNDFALMGGNGTNPSSTHSGESHCWEIVSKNFKRWTDRERAEKEIYYSSVTERWGWVSFLPKPQILCNSPEDLQLCLDLPPPCCHKSRVLVKQEKPLPQNVTTALSTNNRSVTARLRSRPPATKHRRHSHQTKLSFGKPTIKNFHKFGSFDKD